MRIIVWAAMLQLIVPSAYGAEDSEIQPFFLPAAVYLHGVGGIYGLVGGVRNIVFCVFDDLIFNLHHRVLH